jgi:ABC-type sugar transport system substrate-binding protein
MTRRWQLSAVAAIAIPAMLLGACGEGGGGQAEENTSAESAEDRGETADKGEEGDAQPTGALGSPLACGEMTIGFSQPLPNPSIDLIRDILRERGEELGHDVVHAVADLDPNQQISDIDTLLQRGVDVLVAYPVDTEAIQPVLRRADEAGVPIVVVDTTGEGVWDTAVVTGNYSAAKLAGDYLAQELGAGAGVGVVEGPPFAQTLIDRNEGFADAIEEGELELIASQTGDPQSPDEARQIVDAWQLQHGEAIDGILTFSDLNGIGAASALSAGFAPAIVSVNGEPQAIEAIQAGRIQATADVQPVAVALSIFHAAEHAFCGEALPAEIHVPPVMVTPDNADDWLPWADQQESGFVLSLEEGDESATVNTDGLTFGQE